MYLQQVMSQRRNSLKSLGELDSRCPSQCQDIRLAATWGHRRWHCAKNSRVRGTDTQQSVIGGLWNLGLVFRELSRKRTGGWYVENVHWRPPVRIRDGFVAARPISLAIATLFAQLHLAIDGEA